MVGFLLVWAGARPAAAQGEFGRVEQVPDTNWRKQANSGERFDLVFERGFLIPTNQPDSVPLSIARSGSYFIGASINLLFAERWRLRIQPGVSIFKMTFQQSAGKTYPTPADSLSEEKIRNSYIELPIGVAYVLNRDEQFRTVSFLELGIRPGVFLASSYKWTTQLNGEQAKVKLPLNDDFNWFRLGAYAKVTYRFLGFYTYYRFSELFQQDIESPPAVSGLEFGICVQI